MKKIIYFFLAMTLIGCTYEGQNLRTYLEDPGSIVKDPHFSDYKEKRDALESQYLRKEITYAEYVEKMEELDVKYENEVRQRDTIISQ